MQNKKKFVNPKNPKLILDTELVTLTRMNHIFEIVHTSKRNDVLTCYRKLDNSHYAYFPDGVPKGTNLDFKLIYNPIIDKNAYAIFDTDTGELLNAEVHEVTASENRSQNLASLKRTMKNIRYLVNNNFVGGKNELFVTLTYRPNPDGSPMNDSKKAALDFDRFIKRFRRRYPDLEYLAVIEPNESSQLHYHMLCKFTDWNSAEQIRIDNNSVMFPMWGHGWTKTQALNRVDNLGAYLTAYLCNIEITEENKDSLFDTIYKDSKNIEIEEKIVTDKGGKKVAKKFLKGARVHFYESSTNIYRKSKAIVFPISEKMTYQQAREIIGATEPQYSKTISVVGIDGSGEEKTMNTITYENFNLKRKAKKPSFESQIKKYKAEIVNILTAHGYKPNTIYLAEKSLKKFEIYFDKKNEPFELPPNFDERRLDKDFKQAIFVRTLNDDDSDFILQCAIEILNWSKELLPKSHYIYAPERTMREWNEQQNT